jgi:hypothetical protein
MRVRVEGFLQARLRRTLVPATLGIGMSLSGCATGKAVASHNRPSIQADAGEEPVGDFDLRGDMDEYEPVAPEHVPPKSK